MEITNKFGLSEAWVEAVKNDPYDDEGSDLTASGMLVPPYQRKLYREHEAELTEDVMDRVWVLLGSGVHTILERAEPSELTEQRLFFDCLGWKISAKYDRFTLRAKRLTEYKCTSAWTIYYGDRLNDWEAQMNVQAEACIHNGFKVEEIEAEAVLRDWKESDAERVKGYPQKPIHKAPLKLWTPEKRWAYITDRVRLHQEASPPPCSNDERWYKAPKKKGDVPRFIRCDGGYCAAAPVCPVWAEERKAS